MRHTIWGLAMLLLLPVGTAQAEPSPYIGVTGAVSRTEVTNGGANTSPSGFVNRGNGYNVSGGFSFHVGMDHLYQFTPEVSLRGELELRKNTDDKFSSPSFPGFPPPLGAEKYNIAHESYGGLVNLYVDYRLPENPLSLYAGGGAGIYKHDVSVYDSTIRGSKDSAEFAYQLGVGGMYHYNDDVRFTIGARYLDSGSSNIALFDPAPSGNLSLDYESIEVLAGVHVTFDKVAGLFNR